MLSKKYRFFYLSLHAQTETLSQQNANTTNLKADFRMSICGSNFQTEWIQYLSYGKKNYSSNCYCYLQYVPTDIEAPFSAI